MATRRMAEINAAYQALREGGPALHDRAARAAGDVDAQPGPPGRGGARGGRAGAPPRASAMPQPKPGRPVTARLDTSGFLHQRNRTTTTPGDQRGRPVGPAPVRRRAENGPRRASDPNGPLIRSRVRRFRPPVAPSLEVATATVIPFGKFHGHTLGQIAGFEPSYIDWVSGTITRDPDLVAAARVVRGELDRRGVIRRARVTVPGSLPDPTGP